MISVCKFSSNSDNVFNKRRTKKHEMYMYEKLLSLNVKVHVLDESSEVGVCVCTCIHVLYDDLQSTCRS